LCDDDKLYGSFFREHSLEGITLSKAPALLYFVVFFPLAMNAVDTCWVSQKNKRRARAIEKSEMHAEAGISSFEMPCPLWRTDSS
jgi:hypothetical protein